MTSLRRNVSCLGISAKIFAADPRETFLRLSERLEIKENGNVRINSSRAIGLIGPYIFHDLFRQREFHSTRIIFLPEILFEEKRKSQFCSTRINCGNQITAEIVIKIYKTRLYDKMSLTHY